MTPSSKAKVRTDAGPFSLDEVERLRNADLPNYYVRRLIATIDALKADVDDLTETNQDLRQSRDLLEAELALKDKVVEALRKARDDLRRGQPRTAAVRLDDALNDLDKVMAR